MKKPKAPKKTAQEVAVERRQTIMLDKEIEEQEDRFRALSRGKRGTVSLLGGAPRSREEAASRGACCWAWWLGWSVTCWRYDGRHGRWNRENGWRLRWHG